jgi:predicted ATP-binding protein involved in virulence
MQTKMKVQELHIQNFRGIRNLDLQNADPSMNVVVGVNGAGKTSFLDSLSFLLSWMIARMKSSSAKGSLPAESDISIGAKSPCVLSLKTEDDVCWTIGKAKSYSASSNTFKSDLSQMTMLADKIVCGIEDGGSVPVLMYYPVDRAIAAAPVNLHKADPEIWDVYKEALSGNANFRALFEWYRRQEDIENEMIRDDASYRDRNLEAIRSAIKMFFPDFSEMRVRRRPRQAMVITKEDEEMEFTQLSQGEKCYLSLVCDIARRLAIANPKLKNPLEGEGIVLIDEIDLHLHPKWQSEVVSKLTTVFPNCQFFLSTHSALVLSDVRRSQIIPLCKGEMLYNSFDTYGKLSSSIMANYFDVSNQRNQKVAKQINEAFDAVREGNVEKFHELKESLLQVTDMSDPDMTSLVIEATRRGIR